MPLHLYRRHFLKAGKCVGGHAPDARTYEPEELRRSHKSCICPIYADGTLDRHFKRKNTGKHAWDEARAVSEQWEQAGCWDQPVQANELWTMADLIRPRRDRSL